jgi:hypothetical protein
MDREINPIQITVSFGRHFWDESGKGGENISVPPGVQFRLAGDMDPTPAANVFIHEINWTSGNRISQNI